MPVTLNRACQRGPSCINSSPSAPSSESERDMTEDDFQPGGAVCVDSFVMKEDKAERRQKRGGAVLHVALDFAGAEEELGATVMDAARIPSPESLEEFFEKEWVRSLFGLAVEDLRALCAA